MKKAIYILLLLTLSSTLVNAQWTLGASYQFGITGEQMYSSEMKNSVAGVNVKLKYDYDDYLKFSLGTGYYMVPFAKYRVDETQTEVSDLSVSFIPVTVGAEFYFLSQKSDSRQKVKPFAGIDLGWALSLQPESDVAPAKTRNNLIIAPSFGLAYPATDALEVFISARQNIILYEYRDVHNYNAAFTMLGINLGANFTF